ncbi:MAG: hypothetical protein KDI07_18070 [Anaerolineae bacterium]|nr:hypothetical protein [Anaerolineae bacterium]MCB9129652.1 hypothetical protein [Anaerolineales bacterium]MCB0229571.1 hypothetical protein [Anaerolineae bacterium]MCB0234896.1 hypothetical protein [Anaerolineae bacterium]MCB0237649.1 hypothetical protein [Anaerolineae bacterium]
MTLDQVPDAAMELSFDQREMLLEIILSRQIDTRRSEIVTDAETSLAEYRAGKLKPQMAEEVINKLRRELEDSE